MRFLAISFCTLALIPAASNAQQSAQLSKGPTIQSAAVGFRVEAAKVDASTKVTATLARPHAGQDVALMVVGVGVMIAGALVDNNTASTIIIIGGAAMALYGLYHYLE
ncbi:MAG: hypothetical protein M3P26_06920 [Gemmatimonadota bacterium]|nr:hypothetical protein [Gemmatimonadota bacterium]